MCAFNKKMKIVILKNIDLKYLSYFICHLDIKHLGQNNIIIYIGTILMAYQILSSLSFCQYILHIKRVAMVSLWCVTYIFFHDRFLVVLRNFVDVSKSLRKIRNRSFLGLSMALIIRLAKREESLQGNKADFRWSLAPIIYLMRALGIEMDTSSWFSRLGIGLLGLPVFLCNFIVNVIWIAWNFEEFLGNIEKESIKSEQERKNELIYHLAPSIRCVADAILQTSVPLIFNILMYTPKWKNLWLCLDKIQKEFQLDETFHRQCRRQCYIGLALLLLVIIIITYLSFCIALINENLKISRIFQAKYYFWVIV